GILAHRQAGYIPAVFLQAIIISSLANRVESIYTLAVAFDVHHSIITKAVEPCKFQPRAHHPEPLKIAA
ncbi:MAG: hypothetical protein ACRD39_01780, partial [Nitrososphaeraceae archaeon]